MRILIIFSLAILMWSCAGPQSGSLSPDVRSELDKLADARTDYREKYFDLSERIVQIMNEVASVENDAQAIAKLREYLSDNEGALQRLESQFDGWQKHEDDETVVAFITKYNEQASARRIRVLAPRLHSRFAYDESYVADLERLVHLISIRK
ncbi:MAG: hypothetical protein AAFQ68_03440 [Bacteroidota bacterium]